MTRADPTKDKGRIGWHRATPKTSDGFNPTASSYLRAILWLPGWGLIPAARAGELSKRFGGRDA